MLIDKPGGTEIEKTKIGDRKRAARLNREFVSVAPVGDRIVLTAAGEILNGDNLPESRGIQKDHKRPGREKRQRFFHRCFKSFSERGRCGTIDETRQQENGKKLRLGLNRIGSGGIASEEGSGGGSGGIDAVALEDCNHG